MGLQRTSSQAQWVGLSNGVFSVKHGETKEEYAAFSGLLVGIGFVDKKGFEGREYRQMVLTFQSGSEIYKIGLDTRNGYARSIKMKLPNVDLTREFELVPTYKAETKDASCFANQDGIAIKQKWTRDNPGDLPPAESAKLGGKTVWDFSAQEQWLEKYLLDNIGPIAAANLVKPPSGQSSGPSGHDEAGGEESQDNPEDGSGVPADGEDVPF